MKLEWNLETRSSARLSRTGQRDGGGRGAENPHAVSGSVDFEVPRRLEMEREALQRGLRA